MTSSFQCAVCEAVLIDDDESGTDRSPCPACGSTRRLFHQDLQAVLTLYGLVELKHKRPGFKKPIHEQVAGAQFTHSTGRFSDKLRVIDRLNDRYYERITDLKTGKVLHERDEPLSHHYGRGAARLQDHGIPHEQIAVAAYYIWGKKGRLDGNDRAHWNMAIEDLKRAAAGVPTLYS